MASQVKVHVCRLVLLWPRLNSSPIFNDGAAEGSMRKCGAV